MKRILLGLALATTLSVSTMADTYNYLTLVLSSGKQSTALTQTKRITFDGSNIVVTTTDGTQCSYALDILEKLSFTDSPATRVESLNAANNTLPIYIYNVNGQQIRQLDATREKGSINLNGLPQGLYILKQGAETRKIMKQ